MVPPVPTPATNASTFWFVWSHISGPVVVSCMNGFAGLENWFAKKEFGVSSTNFAATSV